jgi:hypothetical protein
MAIQKGDASYIALADSPPSLPQQVPPRFGKEAKSAPLQWGEERDQGAVVFLDEGYVYRLYKAGLSGRPKPVNPTTPHMWIPPTQPDAQPQYYKVNVMDATTTPYPLFNEIRDAYSTTTAQIRQYQQACWKMNVARSARHEFLTLAHAQPVPSASGPARYGASGIELRPQIQVYAVNDYEHAKALEEHVKSTTTHIYPFRLLNDSELLIYGVSLAESRQQMMQPPRPAAPPLPAEPPRVETRQVAYPEQSMEIQAAASAPPQDGYYSLIARDPTQQRPPLVLSVRTDNGNTIPFATRQLHLSLHQQPQASSLIGWCNPQDPQARPVAYDPQSFPGEWASTQEVWRYFNACQTEYQLRSLGAQRTEGPPGYAVWDLPAVHEGQAHEALRGAGIMPVDPTQLNGANDGTPDQGRGGL